MADERVVNAVKIVDATTTSQEAVVDGSGNIQVILASNTGVDIGDVDVLSIIPGTGATNLGKAIDSVAGATDTGVAILGTRDDALAGVTPIEGDYVNLLVDANGALWTHDNALDAALAGSELQVDIVTGPTGASSLQMQGTAADGAAPVGNPVLIAGHDGTNVQFLKTDVNGELQVDVLSGGGAETPSNPTVNTASSTDTAAGANANLDSAVLNGQEYLSGCDVTAAVAFKYLIQTVAAATTTVAQGFGRAGQVVQWRPPHRHFAGVSGDNVDDVFRAVVTNMDTSQPSDLYATFYYQDN